MVRWQADNGRWEDDRLIDLSHAIGTPHPAEGLHSQAELGNEEETCNLWICNRQLAGVGDSCPTSAKQNRRVQKPDGTK
jgi:hypothetical protein